MKEKSLSRRSFMKYSAATAAVLSMPIMAEAAGISDDSVSASPAAAPVPPDNNIKKNMSNSDDITRDYFDSLLLETRYLDSGLASTKLELFGHTFDTPIMTAALSHLNGNAPDGMAVYAKGAAAANAVHWMGMGEDAELEAVLATGAKTIKVIKPHADNAEVFCKIKHAVDHGCFAIGMDIDHAFNTSGGYDNVYGLPMKSKSTEEIAAFVKAAGVPFIVKGVLSVHDAKRCLEAGCAGIVLSHHHNMMPFSVPPIMMMDEIKKVVGDKMKIFVDCGIVSGMDAYKCLASGATAVSVGRHLMDLLKDGPEAITKRIQRMTAELATVMSRTGVTSLDKMDPTVIHRRTF